MTKEEFIKDLIEEATRTNETFLQYVKNARVYGFDLPLREVIAKVAVFSAEAQIFAKRESLKADDP